MHIQENSRKTTSTVHNNNNNDNSNKNNSKNYSDTYASKPDLIAMCKKNSNFVSYQG